MRRHMRKYFWQRWHNRKGRQNALRRLDAKSYHLRQASNSVSAWRLARCPMLQTVLQKQVETLGTMGSIRFRDIVSHQVQPPDAENRMSGGVGEVMGAIPSPQPDPISATLPFPSIPAITSPPLHLLLITLSLSMLTFD